MKNYRRNTKYSSIGWDRLRQSTGARIHGKAGNLWPKFRRIYRRVLTGYGYQFLWLWTQLLIRAKPLRTTSQEQSSHRANASDVGCVTYINWETNVTQKTYGKGRIRRRLNHWQGGHGRPEMFNNWILLGAWAVDGWVQLWRSHLWLVECQAAPATTDRLIRGAQAAPATTDRLVCGGQAAPSNPEGLLRQRVHSANQRHNPDG